MCTCILFDLDKFSIIVIISYSYTYELIKIFSFSVSLANFLQLIWYIKSFCSIDSLVIQTIERSSFPVAAFVARPCYTLECDFQWRDGYQPIMQRN